MDTDEDTLCQVLGGVIHIAAALADAYEAGHRAGQAETPLATALQLRERLFREHGDAQIKMMRAHDLLVEARKANAKARDAWEKAQALVDALTGREVE